MSIKNSALKDAGAKESGAVYTIPFDKLTPDPNNIRTDTPEETADIEAMARNMVDYGWRVGSNLLVITVDGQIIVHDGNRRYRAWKRALELGWDRLSAPCILMPKGYDQGDLDLEKIKANDGKSNTPLETAEYIKRAIRNGKSEADVCRILGRTRTWLDGILTLGSASPDVKAAVVAGQVSATEAIKQVRQHGTKAGVVIAEAVTQSKTGRVTAKALKPPVTPLAAPHQPALGVSGDLVAAVTEFLRLWDDEAERVSLSLIVEDMRAALPKSAPAAPPEPAAP
jgi:ParB-like chromosome segregation protein Spo0J